MRTLKLVLLVCLAVGCSQSGSAETDMAWPHGAADLTGSGDASGNPAPDAASSGSFSEPFPGADTAPWPARWSVLGGVAAQSQQGGRGRLVPTTSMYSLARMGVAQGWRDVDVTFQVQFESIGAQGVGYYVRQNGGWLRGTATRGEGYAIFVEGFRGSSRLGVWREVDGQEMEIMFFTGFAAQLQSNVLYQLRLRVTQATPTQTRLQARVWNAGQAEPATWQVDAMDGTPSLQNVIGGMAIDSYNSQTAGTITAATFVDNVLAIPG